MNKNDLIILLLLMIAMKSMGQGTTGAQFLEIGVGPRACAMGEAYTAIADDPSAMYWNPAGLIRMSTMDFMFSQNFWLLDMSMQHCGGVVPTQWGTLGFGVFYSSSGSIPQIEEFLKTGDYSAYDAALSLGYARPVLKGAAIGINAKYILSKIEKVNASTYALDAGVLYDVAALPGFHAGLSIQNIGPGLKFIEQEDPLPLCLRIGVGFDREELTLGAAISKYIDGETDIGIGAEYVLRKALALRLGYNTRNALSGGFGLVFTRLDIGYAILHFRDIGTSHLISLRIRNF